MTINNQISGEGERTSFFKLFADHDFRIVIPMLQREYAQGRDNAKEVRTEFLKSLYAYLDEGTTDRDLDFIYGNISDGEFIPLDGQQRLTTLFLLHWYLSRITDDVSLREAFDAALLDTDRHHCRFTYRTRMSSQEFCDALMLNDIDFTRLFMISDGVRNGAMKESIKAIIEDYNWFHLSWKHDPTIVAMLTMLDAIHDFFKGRPDFLPRLLDTQRPVITFLFMELDKYHLSDELYIKMNSRGKPLPEFENFKARYTEHVHALLSETGESMVRKLALSDGTVMTLPLDRYFAQRVDNRWVNMIWAYRQDGGTDTSDDYGEVCDTRMANLLRVILSLKYVELHPQVKGETDEVFTVLANQSGREMLSFLTLRDGDALSLGASSYLIDAMDILTENGSKLSNPLSANFQHGFPIEAVMSKVLFSPRDLTYNDRVMLYAYLGYVMKYGVNDGLDQWMRVVYNLANSDNNRIDSASELSNAIRSFNALLLSASSILQYLADNKPVDSFPSWLVEEERMKALIILNEGSDKDWLDKILEAERHGYFNGQIGFILEFAGIWNAFQSDRTLCWTVDTDNEYYDRFVRYSRCAQAVFAKSYEHRVNDENYCFERAVLFKGDYLPSNNLHYNLLSTSTVKNNVKRDFSWKRLLRLDKDADATRVRNYVKEVFDDPAFDFKSPNASLQAVFNGKSTGELWRDTLIKYPSAIAYSGQGFISFFNTIEGCEGVLPMSSSRLSGYHIELYSWALYCELSDMSPAPFATMAYGYKKVNDELPFLYFDCYKFGQCIHWLAVTAVTDPDDWSLARFNLEFIRKDKQIAADNLEVLHLLLTSEGFCRSEGDEKVWFIHLDSIDAVKEFIHQFLVKLTKL